MVKVFDFKNCSIRVCSAKILNKKEYSISTYHHPASGYCAWKDNVDIFISFGLRFMCISIYYNGGKQTWAS